MCLMQNARIAALFSFFDPRSGMLAIRAPDGSAVVENALTASGRERIGSFLADYMGEEARGAPAFHYVEGHSFCDQRRKVVSLINLASLRDYRGAGRRAAAPAAVPRQCLVLRRTGLGGAWTGSASSSSSAARCCG